MSAEYKIRTVDDFLPVPDDRIDSCLLDFKQWIKFKKNTNALIAALSEEASLPEGSVVVGDVFLWIDDGIDGLSRIEFSDENGESLGEINLLEAE